MKGVFMSDEELNALFERLDRIESLIKSMPVASEPKPKNLLTRRAAAFFISQGRLPENLNDVPEKGLTRFDTLVNSGKIKYVLAGGKKKMYREEDLAAFIFQNNN